MSLTENQDPEDVLENWYARVLGTKQGLLIVVGVHVFVHITLAGVAQHFAYNGELYYATVVTLLAPLPLIAAVVAGVYLFHYWNSLPNIRDVAV